jgi:hypothetical protein
VLGKEAGLRTCLANHVHFNMHLFYKEAISYSRCHPARKSNTVFKISDPSMGIINLDVFNENF